MRNQVKLKLLLVQIISILPFLLFIFYLFDVWYDSRRSAVLEKNQAYANFTVELINNTFNHYLNLNKFLAYDKVFYKNLKDNPEIATSEIKNLVEQSNGALDYISINEIQGKSMINTLPSNQEEISLVDRPYFQKVLSSKNSAISNPVFSRYTGKNVVIISTPIILEGEIAAVINSAYNLQILKNTLEKALDNKTGYLMILDEDGNMVLTTNKTFSEEDKSKIAEYSFVKTTQGGKITYIENTRISFVSSKTLMGVSIPMASLGWTIVSLEPVETIFIPLVSLQRIIWLIIISALIFAFALFTYSLRKVRIVY